MEAVFSREIQAGLEAARVASLKKASRLRVCVGAEVKPVLRMWKTGFAMGANEPALRGLVNLYDGSVHLFQCLIIATEEDSVERRYAFKRVTAVADRPAADFEVLKTAPVGLIEDTR